MEESTFALSAVSNEVKNATRRLSIAASLMGKATAPDRYQPQQRPDYETTAKAAFEGSLLMVLNAVSELDETLTDMIAALKENDQAAIADAGQRARHVMQSVA